ncbi:hypothetical protein [Stutzerimonas stutzeri]|uniref:hypothetical protein n=1 Tax=Stutzerimonas stutzeri TaxID=316 RepID=UPI00210C1503|nr:hypothetical protein [Stutzerimonas stutzeri]MCQ4322870.1 hypothetical protein [Stutzerimonas stutzeri]
MNQLCELKPYAMRIWLDPGRMASFNIRLWTAGCSTRCHRARGVWLSDLIVAVSLNLPSQKRDLLPVIETAAAAHVALRGMSGSLTAYLSFLCREDAAALELAPACQRKTASPAGSSPTRTTRSRTPGQATEPWVGVTASVDSDWLLTRV